MGSDDMWPEQLASITPVAGAMPLQDFEALVERDYDEYFLMNTVYLLRTLKVIDGLSEIQKKVVEEHCKLRAATMREDIQKIKKAHTEAVVAAVDKHKAENICRLKPKPDPYFHNHVCSTCSPDGIKPGNGCINCRQSGYDQTPCPNCPGPKAV